MTPSNMTRSLYKSQTEGGDFQEVEIEFHEELGDEVEECSNESAAQREVFSKRISFQNNN